MYEAVDWPDDMKPSRCPIHFTNEIEAPVRPETIWSLLTDSAIWPSFYPGVRRVDVIGGTAALRLGTRFETNLAGQDVSATVRECVPTVRIAWGGGPKSDAASRAYHAWIITPTINGTHLWTEETMRGPVWIALAREAPDAFWRAHEALLANLVRVAAEREGRG